MSFQYAVPDGPVRVRVAQAVWVFRADVVKLPGAWQTGMRKVSDDMSGDVATEPPARLFGRPARDGV